MTQGGFFSQTSTSTNPNHLRSKNFYFMAGLPRAGSTLLSSILNQNPKFYSGPSSPVLSTMYAVENHLMNDELYHGYPKPDQVHQMISNIIRQFYGDVNQEVIIDKNRAWTARVPYIEGYIGQKAKIICPVRDIDEILTSMIMMIRRNPYKEGNPRINFIDEQLVKLNIPLNDDNRCEYIAGPEGILGQSLNAIMEGFNQGFGDRIHFVEYKDLVSNPEKTLKKLYEFLSEEYFEHEFENLENQNREEDMNTYGLSDMHEVRPELKNTAPKPIDILSPHVLEKCNGMDFWRTKPYAQSLPKYINTAKNQLQIIR
jgi:sulfotransferase